MQNSERHLEQLGKIYAGQIHYNRLPHQYWQHRIQMIKSLGLNALSVYIMWNYHEIDRGVFDFENENRNLPKFLQLASKYQMKVLFRPGPYVCAQWDFGGLPSRLLAIDGLQIRANNKLFLQETQIYFTALVPIMKKYIKSPGNPNGCIVMLQIQNQYGFYGNDKSYMQAIRNIWKNLDISIHEYYVDWPHFLGKCHWDNAIIGVNNFKSKFHQFFLKFYKHNGVMGGQIYTGWMTHWTQKWQTVSPQTLVDNVEFLLQNGYSFALYVIFGGTNFGLTAGANGLSWGSSDYWGALTSYDYGAPINEQGSPTQKYYKLRQLLKKYITWQIPQIPHPLPQVIIPQFYPQKYARLFNDNLPKINIVGDKPYLFQSNQLKMFNQGMVLYQTILHHIDNVSVKIVVHDFALVYIGNQLIQVLDRTKNSNHSFTIKKQLLQQYGNKLRILVQASGHINFGQPMKTDFKGIYSIGGDLKKQQEWLMYKIPIQFQQIQNWNPLQDISQPIQDFPILLKAKITLQIVGDVYLNMDRYGKGYVWVNGRNLGRYWSVGPQQRLFCPGCWLKQGQNIIHILNIWGPSGGHMSGFHALTSQQQEKKCQIM